MTTKRQNTKEHYCGLPDEPDDIVSTMIEQGIFVHLRRKIKRWSLISPKHPLCRSYINSLNLLRQEERRHLVHNNGMIHPLSMFNFYWKMYICFNIFISLLIWPSFIPHFNPSVLTILFVVSNASFLVLIVLSFYTGYYDRSQNYVVLKSRKVAVYYLRTYFLFDILAIGPIAVKIIVGIFEEPVPVPGMSWPVSTFLYWILPLFRFGRYPYFLSGLQEIKIYYGMNHYLFQAAVTLINFIYFLLFTIAVTYVIMEQIPEFGTRSHLGCVESSISMILMVSHGYHNSHNLVDKIFPIVFITSGFVVHVLIYVFIMQIWYQFYSTENKQISVYNAMNAFMRYKALPLHMRNRILLYLDFKYQRHFYKESSIIRATSPFLRKEILIKISKESTHLVDMFQKIPERLLEKLRARLVSIIYLPGDSIIKAGSKGKNMFFIKSGTVKVTAPNGHEIRRLRDGANFGEIALVANLPRVATVTAVTPCELYVLSRVHFLEVLTQYPELLKEVNMVTKERIAEIEVIPNKKDDTVTEASINVEKFNGIHSENSIV